MVKRRLAPVLIGFVLLAGLVALRAADPYPLQVLRQIAFDTYQRLAPRPATNFPVRVVDIDEASLAALGQWPWSRARLATLTERLTDLGAAAIAFDILFPEPDGQSPHRVAQALGLSGEALADTDSAFAAAIRAGPVVLGFADSAAAVGPKPSPKAGVAISGTDPTAAMPFLRGAVVPIAPLLAAATGLGSVSLEADAGARAVHRLPLVWTDGAAVFPTLAIEALRVAVGASTIVVLGEQDAPFVEAVRVGGFSIPTNSWGGLWLYYRPPDPTLFVPAATVLGSDHRALRERIEGHIVIVGTSAAGLLDIHGTALGDNVPGAAIHAQAIEQVLAGLYLTRADWVSGLEIAGFAAAGLLLVATVLALGPMFGLAVGAAALAGAVVASWLAFRNWGLMLDPSFPLVALATLYAALVFARFTMADTDRRMIRRAFSHYVAPTVLAEIERNADRLTLGGARREITVMFTDMRDFTGLTERYPAEDILRVLNVMFGSLGQCIIDEKGTIDKFVGDSIMAFWNAPLDVSGHAEHACRAALGMRDSLRALNAQNAFGLDGAGVAIGIGLASGEALVGNMGLPSRFDYSAVGDTVNLASRVEGACKSVGYDILVSESVRLSAPDFATLPAGSLRIRGKTRREPLHLLVGDASLATTTDFIGLATVHTMAMHALAHGADAEAAIAQCVAKATGIDTGLLPFYSALPARAEDYRLPVEDA